MENPSTDSAERSAGIKKLTELSLEIFKSGELMPESSYDHLMEELEGISTLIEQNGWTSDVSQRISQISAQFRNKLEKLSSSI